ncbi:MAG: sigma-70 family RNA polymerase sigma factor [Planctomycetota bacterium]
MGTPDDTQLLAQLASEGDETALALLIERHLPGLRAFVRARLGPELRAQESTSDLVQSTCREILGARERFQHPSPGAFRSWLFTTAARKVTERLRHARAVKRDAGAALRVGADSGAAESRLLAVYGRFSSPSHRAALADEVARIEGALDRLSDEQRDVVLMAHVVELPRAEIAERLGKSEVAVRSILHRALSRVADALDRN